jgi:hypothetical protein
MRAGLINGSGIFFLMATTEDNSSGATKSTSSAESRVNVASPHFSGG